MSGQAQDAGAVRAGETLDLERLDPWLKANVPGLAGSPQVTQYSRGASNWTYRLQYPTHDLVLRRPPEGTKSKSSHDMVREYTIQKALKPLFPAVPTMLALCQDPAVLGCDFYVMQRIDGLILRRDLPPEMKLAPEDARRMCTSMLDELIRLHRVDHRAAGLAGLARGPGYPRRQVEGWSDRYVKAKTWNVPSFARVRAWLKDHTPDDAGSCVIHGDWRFDNMVLDRADLTKVIGVLDWELATIGDPLMELGSLMAYWVHADDPFLMRLTRRQPTHLPGMMRREEVVEYYLDRTGLKTDSWAFYEVYGLFRLAGIGQQIYYRYHHRQTRNPAFKRIWILCNYFDWRCRRIIRRSRRVRALLPP